jgi:hypothetical protein
MNLVKTARKAIESGTLNDLKDEIASMYER